MKVSMNSLIMLSMLLSIRKSHARTDFCDEDDYGGAVHRCLHGIMFLIRRSCCRKQAFRSALRQPSWLKGDERILEALHFEQNEKDMLEHIITQMEEEAVSWTGQRPLLTCVIPSLKSHCGVRRLSSRWSPRNMSALSKIDRVLTGKYTAIPAFIGIMALVFYLTFNVIGANLQHLLEEGIDALTMRQWMPG
jgi:ferrous iron transport protein B